jgi:hypothetical protein
VDRNAADVAAPQFDFAAVKARALRQTDLLGSRPERQIRGDPLL